MSNKVFYTNVDVHRGNIYFRGYDMGGMPISKKVVYEPTIFLPSNEEKSNGWRTIYGDPVEPIKMKSISDMVDYTKGLDNVCGFTSMSDQKFAFINDVIPGDVEFNPEFIKKLILDIEIETDGGFPDIWDNPFQKINAITVWEEKLGYVTWGLGKYTKPLERDWEYREFTDEAELLHDFCKTIKQEKPDILSGWNLGGFDLIYIINRLDYIGHREWANLLSPWGFAPQLTGKKAHQKGLFYVQDSREYRIPGVTNFDYMNLYKKFCMSPRESYSLNSIASIELGEKKTDYSEFDSLMDLYKKNWNLFTEYNKRDVYLVKRLDDKLKYFNLGFTYAYLGKVNFEDIFGTVKYWDVKIYNELYHQKIAVPPHSNSKDESSILGGFVKEPHIGMHKWVASFDIDSLYPNLIVEFNMSPETIIDRDVQVIEQSFIDSIVNMTFDNSEILNENVCLTANGQYFSHAKKGFIPAIIEKVYDKRRAIKKEMLSLEKKLQTTTINKESLKDKIERLNAEQYSLKIGLNSLYGALAQINFRYYDNRIASAITTTGQAVIRTCEKNCNEYINKVLKTNKDYVIAIDTDSVFLCLEDLINKYCKDQSDVSKIIDSMDKISSEKILPMMAQGFKNIYLYLNGYSERLSNKRESLASKGVWIKKKKYVMQVYDNEGVRYSEPKLKVKGIEIVRSSTPQICRDAIKEGVQIIFDKGESAAQDYIREFKEKFINSSPDDVAFPRGVRDIEKWIDDSGFPKTSTPMQVTASYNFNKLVERMGLENKYTKIRSGDKIKFLYLKKPNPLFNINKHSHTIAFPTLLPKEFLIEPYIDYETQFDKAFLSPIKSIMDAIGWDVSPKTDLLSLFY